jgi:hypothetical protein
MADSNIAHMSGGRGRLHTSCCPPHTGTTWLPTANTSRTLTHSPSTSPRRSSPGEAPPASPSSSFPRPISLHPQTLLWLRAYIMSKSVQRERQRAGCKWYPFARGGGTASCCCCARCRSWCEPAGVSAAAAAVAVAGGGGGGRDGGGGVVPPAPPARTLRFLFRLSCSSWAARTASETYPAMYCIGVGCAQ